jgi:hypothetical protein
MTKTSTRKIESQEDWNGNSLSVQSSLYSLLVLCPMMWSQQSITWLVVDRAIWLQWDHSIDDSSTGPSYNLLSWDTWKHYKLGTSCSVYALDKSRTTPLVEEVPRQDVIHFSQIPMSMAGVSHQWGNFWKETSFGVWSDTTFTCLARRKGWTLDHFVKPRGPSSTVSEKQGVHLTRS